MSMTPEYEMDSSNYPRAVAGSYGDQTNAFTIKDSGSRQQFSTGAVRDNGGGRGRFDLVPAYPLLRLAQHYESGAKKYEDRNWEKGIPLANYLNSAERHINAFKDGDRSEDHLAAATWNLFGYIWTEEMIRRGVLPTTLDAVGQHLTKLRPKEEMTDYVL